jgi:hypothetical protein
MTAAKGCGSIHNLCMAIAEGRQHMHTVAYSVGRMARGWWWASRSGYTFVTGKGMGSEKLLAAAEYFVLTSAPARADPGNCKDARTMQPTLG